jgi:hypothetical protein
LVLRLDNRVLQDGAGLRAWLELFSLLDADGLQLPHDGEIARLHRLVIHHSREAVVEFVVEVGDAVEQLPRDIDVPLRRRVASL